MKKNIELLMQSYNGNLTQEDIANQYKKIIQSSTRTLFATKNDKLVGIVSISDLIKSILLGFFISLNFLISSTLISYMSSGI